MQIAAVVVPGRGLSGKSAVEPYEVGTYKDLKNRSPSGDGLDIHHVPQAKPAGQAIDDYDYWNAPAIAIPRSEHRVIPTQKGEYTGTAKDLVEQNLQELRVYTNAPEEQIQALQDLIESTFPGVMDDGDLGGEGAVGGE